MKLKKLQYDFSICKVKDYSKIDLHQNYFFTAKTEEESSLVCPTKYAPDNTIEREDDWKALRVEGTLDFSLIGVLAGISALLAENEIGIFVISTFHTDYILVKKENILKAAMVLEEAGYDIV